MISNDAKVELKRELERLTALRDHWVRRIDGKIQAIRNLLADEDDLLPFETSAHAPVNNGTFASQVRAALTDIGKPARAMEVAHLLMTRGVAQRGKSPLKQDVATELHRMAARRTGGVQKVAKGLYAIVDGGRHGLK